MIFDVRAGELIAARVAKTASAAIGVLIKLRDQLPLHDLMAGNDHLSDALTVVERKGLLGEIDHKDLQLTTIIRIDSPRAIGQGNTMLQCKSTTRSDLRFVAFGDLKEEARGNKAALERLQYNRLREISTDVHASSTRCGVVRSRMVRLIDQLDTHRRDINDGDER